MFVDFFHILYGYCVDILPVLFIGFLLSGVIHELVPEGLIEKYLGRKGISGILYSTLVGAIVPVCCFGSLPIAVSFYRRGASIGAVLAMLIATPATSVTAFLVTVKFFGIWFALFLAFSVILMAVSIGLIANMINFDRDVKQIEKETCPHCTEENTCKSCKTSKSFVFKLKSILKYAFIDMPKSLGLSLSAGIVLAALVKSLTPLDYIIGNYLKGLVGYLFSVIFSLTTYMCATMSVPLVDALTQKGLGIGQGLVLLLIGPITSYGTIFILKKEFGSKLLLYYLGLIVTEAVALGYLFSVVS